MGRASFSLSSCLDVVPEDTREWNPEQAPQAEKTVTRAISLLGDRVRGLHMKDFVLTPEGKMEACACGLGSMRYETLLAFAKQRNLPMTLENTTPDNAEEARLTLERIAAAETPE